MMKRLVLLCALCALCASPPVSAHADRTFTPTITVATTSGTVATDARTVDFIFSTDFAGTVLGATFAGANDASVRFEASGEKLGPIVYTVTAGSVRIVVIR